jgi:hypothetical protein
VSPRRAAPNRPRPRHGDCAEVVIEHGSGRGQGWWGATAKTQSPRCPAGLLCRPAAVVAGPDSRQWPGRPDRRSAPPACRTGFRRAARRVGGAREKKAQAQLHHGGREMMPSTAMVSCGSQPVATRLTRLATASMSCSRRPPSRSSSRRPRSAWPGASCGRTAARPARPRSGARGRSGRWAPDSWPARPPQSCRLSAIVCSMARASGVRHHGLFA